MSQPTAPWSSTPTYPTTPATKWAGTLTKVNPAFTSFVPGQTPTAQELNALLYNRDVAINGVGSTGAEVAIANFGPVSSGQISGSLYKTYAVCFDHGYAQWVAALNNGTSAAAALYTSQDGATFVLSTGTAALPNASLVPNAVGAYTSGTIVIYGNAGGNGFITRCTQGAGPTSVATNNNAWAIRSAALCNQGVMAFFWGANTPAMYFIGASQFGARAAWLGFAASDSAANDGAGTAGVWTDLHTSLPASFLSGSSLIAKYETAQSATTLCVAMCGMTTATDASFLLSIAANGTMSDATPSFIGMSRSIRGIAYSSADGLWGLLSVDAGGTSYFDVSPDLVTWTNVLGLSAQAVGLTVLRNTWAIAFSFTTSSVSDRCLYLSNVAQVLAGSAPLTHYSSYPPFANTWANGRVLTLQSNEIPLGVPAYALMPRSPQVLAAYLSTNSNCSFSQSLRQGHVDTLQSGAALPSAAPGWNIGLDVDFTKLASATYAANGAQTIGPYSWTKSNSANERVALANVLGTGLTFAPSATKSGPFLYLPLTSFLPANVLLWSTGFRVWVWYEAQNFAATGDQFRAGLTLASSIPMYESLYGVTAGPVGFVEALAAPTPVTSQQNFAGMPGASSNVVVLDVPSLAAGASSVMTGQYNAGVWPTEAGSLYLAAHAESGTVQWQDPSTGSPLSPSAMGLGLLAQAGATANLAITIGRVRVDYKL